MSQADPFNLITAPDQSGFGFGMLMPTPSREQVKLNVLARPFMSLGHGHEERVKLNVLARPFMPACMEDGAATEAETGLQSPAERSPVHPPQVTADPAPMPSPG